MNKVLYISFNKILCPWWSFWDISLTLICISLTCTSSANNFAQKQKRKTLTAADVFDALDEMEFEQFVKPLKESLACEYNCIKTENQLIKLKHCKKAYQLSTTFL